MKAFVTSIGETTTEICCEQLRKFGFKVVLMDKEEPWLDKYKYFINNVNEDCLRIDADMIPNEDIKELIKMKPKWAIMVQGTVYDFYKNAEHIGQGVFYTKKALEIIRQHLDKLHPARPEASAWRLPDVNPYTFTWRADIVGMHGFFQKEEDMKRAERNKKDRGQIDYNFKLAWELKKRFFSDL